MVLKLYGSAMATSRVLTVILEKQLPYELITIDISKGDQKAEEYRKLQPFGKVPALNDNGFLMYESRAICRYLERKYDSGAALMPQEGDPETYGRFEQACSVEQSYFAAAAELIGTELTIRKKLGLESDMARVAQAERDLDAVLAVYEETLSKHKYLTGNDLSLVDLFHLPNGAALKAFGWKAAFERYPNVDRWFSELQERKSWIQAAAEAGTVA
ncbi:glutathione S-transferase [Aaosphaeria arxii CBS 175.79]|uniref:glutathione transferase n=1 Tax=Aaosphaeria arxii CBS 175.79 TaxID=1450172 RepID=A0A6A5XGE5_9PLEO|nr:glutathione S-transferase [Aaosphaeria arxii CBS 175.79]KAF2012003.1 glutathione S-transferase [Aaosphaeria arxii CBS 175.79]